jgi:hypothetical protein
MILKGSKSLILLWLFLSILGCFDKRNERKETQSTAADKADKYKKVFGDCCDVVQTQIIS